MSSWLSSSFPCSFHLSGFQVHRFGDVGVSQGRFFLPFTVVKECSPQEIVQIREAQQSGFLHFTGRSGLCRSGFNPVIDDHGLSIDDRYVSICGKMFEYLPEARRGCSSPATSLLWAATRLHAEGTPLELGRLTLLMPGSRLGQQEVQDAIAHGFLRFSDKSLRTILEDGTIASPLETVRFSNAALNLQDVSNVFLHGKHALHDSQRAIPFSAGERLETGGSLVSAIRVSVGPGLFVFIEDCSQAIHHLSARVLDGVKTTGLIDEINGNDIYRQVELIHQGEGHVAFEDIKIRMSVYRAPAPSHFWDDLDHLTPLPGQAMLHGLCAVRSLSARRDLLAQVIAEASNYAVFAGGAGCLFLSLQEGRPPNLANAAKIMSQGERAPGLRRDGNLPGPLSELSAHLRVHGGEQRKPIVFVSPQPPQDDWSHHLVESGVTAVIYRGEDGSPTVQRY